MNFIKYMEPWTNWNNTQINGGAIDIMLTENGREASVGQFSISGFNFDNLDVGEYVSFVGSPHIWAIDAAEYDSDADETTYTIIDAFCHTLKNRLLGFDLYTNQRLIDSRIGVILDAVADSYPGLDGWNLYPIALGDASKLIDPRTNLAETSRAGDSVLDVIYSVIEVTDICLWITTRILNETTLQAILCYRMLEDPITAPKNTTIKRTFRAKGERMFIVEGRTLDYSINDTGVSPDTQGTGPSVENFSGITQTLDAVTGERAKIHVGGPDNWTRAALTLTPSAVGRMVTFNGAMPTPLFAVYRRRIWMRCNVKWTGLAGAPAFPGISGYNAVIVPYMDPTIANLLKRNDTYYNGYDCYIGWMSAYILVTDAPNVTITFKQSCNINTDPNTPITTDFGNFVLSDFSSKVFGAGRKAGCAVIGMTTGSLSANDKCWIPLTGSADPTLGLDFHQLDPSNADDLKILSAPMAYPLDLWRVPYASLMSTEKAIREEAVNTAATIDLDSNGFNVDNLGDKNGGLWVGSLIRSTMGDLFRVTAITTSYNDDGTPKYDIETMPGTL